MAAGGIQTEIEFGVVLHFEDVKSGFDLVFDPGGKIVFLVGDGVFVFRVGGPNSVEGGDLVFAGEGRVKNFFSGIKLGVETLKNNDGNFPAHDKFLQKNRLFVGVHQKVDAGVKMAFVLGDGSIVNFN